MLLDISKSSNEYLTMASFEVFEVMFEGMADEVSSAKLPHLLEILEGLQPPENDAQLMPPWIAVLSRGYDVSAQVMPEETFLKLPDIFTKVAQYVGSMSNNIRVSAADCLISFLVNCVPVSIIIEPSIYDEKVLEKLAKAGTDLLSVKYQSAWMEAFKVLEAMISTFRWRSGALLSDIVRVIGHLRASDSFNGKNEADAVISKAITAMGPEAVLEILPLNLLTNTSQPGRVWLLPLMRDSVSNTRLAHFKTELVPLSEKMFQRILDHGEAEKTVEVKIYETIVNQIWGTLPGYCDLPIDLQEVRLGNKHCNLILTVFQAFDQKFAELLSNILYQQVDLRIDLCKALQRAVDSNKELLELPDDDPSIGILRVSKSAAQMNLKHLESFASNFLAVLFNVYTQTLPQYRGPILQCINAYLSITSEKDLVETFERVVSMLENSLAETNGHSKGKPDANKQNQMPPLSHTLMDLVIAIASYLPRTNLAQLFGIAVMMLNKDDPNLQKKAYKIIPRLAESEVGKQALRERSEELQALILGCSEKVLPAARRDRLFSISQLIEYLPTSDIHFIPAVLPEVVLCTKENNEKTRKVAYDLLVSMGETMQKGGTILNAKIPHMPPDSLPVTASLEEYFTMVSAGLAGSAPHSVSACITALTRILFHFCASLSPDTLSELVQTMDIFLSSPNREIVRAVLGFVKVSIISLPTEIIQPRLKTLIPNLLSWSHEHKSHVQAKVKHIFERLIRRFGVDAIEILTPEGDRKLIANIRKTRERRKKKKSSGAADSEGSSDEDDGQPADAKQRRFASGLDEAIYGSGEDDSDDGSDVSDDEVLGRHGSKKKAVGGTYIVENEDEPLDLLDKKSLGRISTSMPLKRVWSAPKQRKAKVDLDGKLILGDGDNERDSVMQLDTQGSTEGQSGVNAYMDAVKGGNAPRKGQRGKLKFSNKPGREQDDDENDEMLVDGEPVRATDVRMAREKARKLQHRGKMGGSPGKGGMKAARAQRRGLGQEKTRGGRVMKGMGKVGRH
jgi:ribosomal RNA-processing protein 12